ncbi:T9SS type A sorting domain-containing protein [Pontibacter pudoricolor]|uniref:T9SS type A sorting domain-containing protein n=1 Tax=Pontibacter pudoricolor TaxID=2694930 RepID=UPI001390E3EA|nr:T9SS type A sorting domain-containing protein [Pontibacter pudoricolor]
MIKKFTLLIIGMVLLSFDLYAQFNSVENLKKTSISASTGEKPQSKVWTYACEQWAIFPNADGTFLWQLNGTSWSKKLKLSPSTTSKADCKVVGNVTHILLFQGTSSQLVSLEYNTSSNSYRLWDKRSSTVNITLDAEVETATIDIDGNRRMWLASDGLDKINVRWSDAPYTEWSEAITLATGVNMDDIGAVVALPGKVGVFWSDQNRKQFGFRTHADGTDPAAWSENEVPASQSARDVGKGMANDHINMAVASDGTLYCAIKTEFRLEFEKLPYPLLGLLVRRPSGKWDDLYEVTKTGTRPIVLLNEKLNKIRVIYTSEDTGGDIIYKESGTSNIIFKEPLMLIKGAYNDVTSSKGNPGYEVVILASNKNNLVGVLASDIPDPTDICGIKEMFMAYPNPFIVRSTLLFNFKKGTEYALILYDSKGAKIATIDKGKSEAGQQNTLEFNGDSLARGLYILKLHSSTNNRYLKLIKDN